MMGNWRHKADLHSHFNHLFQYNYKIITKSSPGNAYVLCERWLPVIFGSISEVEEKFGATEKFALCTQVWPRVFKFTFLRICHFQQKTLVNRNLTQFCHCQSWPLCRILFESNPLAGSNLKWKNRKITIFLEKRYFSTSIINILLIPFILKNNPFFAFIWSCMCTHYNYESPQVIITVDFLPWALFKSISLLFLATATVNSLNDVSGPWTLPPIW